MYISTALNYGFQVGSLNLDFRKAFYMVNHSNLIRKLFIFEVCGFILSQLKSYSIDREYQVKVEGNLSSTYNANSGVPRELHFGPKSKLQKDLDTISEWARLNDSNFNALFQLFIGVIFFLYKLSIE